MFDRMNIRAWLAVGWILVFAGWWLTMEFWLLPKKPLLKQLNSLEQNVITENWTAAKEDIIDFEELWKANQLLVQTNNGSEEVTDFTSTLSIAKTLIENEEDDVIEQIAELKDMSTSLSTAFPRP